MKFAKGEVSFEADFPPFLGGDGRAPSPLMYCFCGAMCCYAVTFATQAAMEGVELRTLSIGLQLSVDFRPALGLGDQPPMSAGSSKWTLTAKMALLRAVTWPGVPQERTPRAGRGANRLQVGR